MIRNSNIEVIHLFSTSIVPFEVVEDLSALEKVKNYKYISTNVENSNNCYITENTSILDDFPKEKGIICNYFNIIKDNLLHHEDTDFVMTRSWATKALKNSYCQYHKHSNNYYSGVLYFDNYDKDCAPIEFENPLNDFNNFQIRVSESNIYNSQNTKCLFAKNRLIFFPAYLKHKIGKHRSDIPRYSIAFNFHPCGEYGSGDNQLTITDIK